MEAQLPLSESPGSPPIIYSTLNSTSMSHRAGTSRPKSRVHFRSSPVEEHLFLDISKPNAKPFGRPQKAVQNWKHAHKATVSLTTAAEEISLALPQHRAKKAGPNAIAVKKSLSFGKHSNPALLQSSRVKEKPLQPLRRERKPQSWQLPVASITSDLLRPPVMAGVVKSVLGTNPKSVLGTVPSAIDTPQTPDAASDDGTSTHSPVETLSGEEPKSQEVIPPVSRISPPPLRPSRAAPLNPSELAKTLDKDVDDLSVTVAAKYGLRGDTVWDFLSMAQGLKLGNRPLPRLTTKPSSISNLPQKNYEFSLFATAVRCENLKLERV